MCVKNSTSSYRKILRGTDQNAAVPRIALPMAK
ncbi:unnamed protein product, partial [Rotaria magnacalcarata]